MKALRDDNERLSCVNKLAINIISCATTDRLLQDLLLEFGGNPYILYGLYYFLCGLKSAGRYELLLEVYHGLYAVCRTTVPDSIDFILKWDHAPAYFCNTFLEDMRDFLVEFPTEGCSV